jgi:hypothetical protein
MKRFYFVYSKNYNEWTIVQFDGEFWSYLGGDETTKELPDDLHFGIEIESPTHKPI